MPLHAKTSSWLCADSEYPGQPALSDNRIIGYYKMYEWKADLSLRWEHVKLLDLSRRGLSMILIKASIVIQTESILKAFS